jgi:FAD/FMN-containing dehydrogenase
MASSQIPMSCMRSTRTGFSTTSVKGDSTHIRATDQRSTVALRPKTTQEVSEILKYCNERRLAVVPQGGNTGLVGGSIPIFDEVVVSLQRMNTVRHIDQASGYAVVESGVVLEQLDNALQPYGLTVPLDLGAKGSCHIGGNVSTNAGGIRLLRYGSMHANVLGLEVVLPDGTILDTLNTLRKDNTGYDLKQLFIGAEGTLGIVTQVALLTPVRPRSVQVALFGCKSFDDVVNAMVRAKSNLCEILSACEFVDGRSIRYPIEQLGARDPFEEQYPFYVLIETSGSDEAHDSEKMSK